MQIKHADLGNRGLLLIASGLTQAFNEPLTYDRSTRGAFYTRLTAPSVSNVRGALGSQLKHAFSGTNLRTLAYPALAPSETLDP